MFDQEKFRQETNNYFANQNDLNNHSIGSTSPTPTLNHTKINNYKFIQYLTPVTK